MKITRSMFVSLIVMLGVIVGTAVLVEPVSAGITLNTIDPTATLRGNGHQVVVTGPIGCDRGETVEIRIVVTQEPTGATAEGSFHGRCSGDVQQWTVHAPTRNGPTLTAGSARVDAWAITRAKGELTTIPPHTWWKLVTLVVK